MIFTVIICKNIKTKEEYSVKTKKVSEYKKNMVKIR